MNSKNKKFTNKSNKYFERGTLKHEVHETVDEILSRLYSYDHVLLDSVSELQHDFESFDLNDRANYDAGNIFAYVSKYEYLESKCRFAVSRFAQESLALYRTGKLTRELWDKVNLTMDDHHRVLQQLTEHFVDFSWLLKRDGRR